MLLLSGVCFTKPNTSFSTEKGKHHWLGMLSYFFALLNPYSFPESCPYVLTKDSGHCSHVSVRSSHRNMGLAKDIVL